MATFGRDHLAVLKRMAADPEGKGQVKRLALIVKATEKAQKAVQQTGIGFRGLEDKHSTEPLVLQT